MVIYKRRTDLVFNRKLKYLPAFLTLLSLKDTNKKDTTMVKSIATVPIQIIKINGPQP